MSCHHGSLSDLIYILNIEGEKAGDNSVFKNRSNDARFVLPSPSSRVNGSDYDVLGCAIPDEPPPLNQPGAVAITINGVGCDGLFNVTTNTCDNAVKGVGYCIHVDDNGWIGKVNGHGMRS